MNFLISDIGLSNRSVNSLRYHGVITVKDLLELNPDDLYSFSGLGTKSVTEINEKIQELKSNPDSVNITKSKADKLSTLVDSVKLSDLNINELDNISLGLFKNLTGKGLFTLNSIFIKTDDELKNLYGLTDEHINQINKAVVDYVKGKEHLEDDDLSEESEIIDKPVIGEYLASNTFSRIVYDLKFMDALFSFIKEYDVDIRNTTLLNRTKNTLVSEGCEKLSQTTRIFENNASLYYDLGKKTQQDIKDYFEKFYDSNKDVVDGLYNGDSLAMYSDREVKRRILNLYNEPGKEFKGLGFMDFKNMLNLPEEYSDEKLKEIIGNLLAMKELEYVDYRCYRVYEKFEEYVHSCTAINERDQKYILERLKGKTLEEIANNDGLTRERVRQITKNTIQKIRGIYVEETGKRCFYEDYYIHLYETYDLSGIDLLQLLNISTGIRQYLAAMDIKNGKASLEEALDDPKISLALKIKIKNYLNKGKIFIDGIWIENRRKAIENHFLRNFSEEPVSFENFALKFNEYLDSLNVQVDSSFYYNDTNFRSRINNFSSRKDILWSQNERLRYYDIQGRDYKELLDALSLESYHNTEISTLKFYEDYPELMEKYDLKNEYELYNLLDKIVDRSLCDGIDFKRMPVIRFGEFNKEEAYKAILFKNAPISISDLADLIHEKFGYNKATILGNVSQVLSEYFYNGIFDIPDANMLDEEIELLSKHLTEDFYYYDDINRIYNEVTGDRNNTRLNTYSLKKMGFSLHSSYAIRNYSSVEEYFTSLLTKNDIQEISEFRQRYGYLNAFSNTLTKLRKSREIIEFSPNKFINIHKLNINGIYHDDLERFCDEVCSYVSENEFFTIESLKKDGFTAYLDQLGLPNLFYANLLSFDERFSSITTASEIILYKGKRNIMISDFFISIINKHKIIDALELLDEINDYYGYKISFKSDINAKISESDVFYDKFLDRYYANISLYYNEIEQNER